MCYPRVLGLLCCVLPLPSPSLSLDSGLFDLLFLFRACFELCSEVKLQLKFCPCSDLFLDISRSGNTGDYTETIISFEDQHYLMGKRDFISRKASVLPVLFVLAGYAVPWVHMEGESRFGAASGPARIDVFAWGFSGHPAPIFGRMPEQSTVLWVEFLLSSLLSGRALSFLWWDARGAYLLAGSSACYLLATMVSLFRLSGERKKARLAMCECGLLLVSLLLFPVGVEDAVTGSGLHVIRFSWEPGIYLCVISLILAALPLALRIGPVHIDRSTVARALVEIFRSERCQ